MWNSDRISQTIEKEIIRQWPRHQDRNQFIYTNFSSSSLFTYVLRNFCACIPTERFRSSATELTRIQDDVSLRNLEKLDLLRYTWNTNGGQWKPWTRWIFIGNSCLHSCGDGAPLCRKRVQVADRPYPLTLRDELFPWFNRSSYFTKCLHAIDLAISR